MERAISSDWLGKPGILFHTCTKGTAHENKCALVGLGRLLVGEKFIRVDFDSVDGEKFLRADFDSVDGETLLKKFEESLPEKMPSLHQFWTNSRHAAGLMFQNIAHTHGKFNGE